MNDVHDPDLAPPPRFSIVVPALDEADTIAACLTSLLAQVVEGGVEVIVADNNSTDATAALARSYGVTVVDAPRPGVCHARQAGTERARGEIVVSVDADTTYEPGWLGRIDAYLRANPTHVGMGVPAGSTTARRGRGSTRGCSSAASTASTASPVARCTSRLPTWRSAAAPSPATTWG